MRCGAKNVEVIDSSLYVLGECINTYYKTIREWFIPGYTRWIMINRLQLSIATTHLRVYGADR